MAQDADQIAVCLESGRMRTLAIARDWPGWCRGGRDEAAALRALCDYGPRYARALRVTHLLFQTPASPSAFAVAERLVGNSGTEFGTPNLPLAHDSAPMDALELQRLQTVLRACWQAFDAAVELADGRELSKGPRGGGRDLAKMIQHVEESAVGYLAKLGGAFTPTEEIGPDESRGELRQAIQTTLMASAHGELPTRGPRGGVRWAPRGYVRRLAWHILDHTWELEDRVS